MSNLKPSSHGIVVQNKESGVRYAVSDVNYDSATERKIRDLKPGETVLGYQPKLGVENDAEDDLATPDETPTKTTTPNK